MSLRISVFQILIALFPSKSRKGYCEERSRIQNYHHVDRFTQRINVKYYLLLDFYADFSCLLKFL